MDSSFAYFLQNFIRDALSLNCNYYREPFVGIHSVDQYLRQGLNDSEALYEQLRGYMKEAEYGFFYQLSDNYFLHYIFLRPYEDRKDILCLGPFVKSEVNAAFFDAVAAKNHLTYAALEGIRGLLYQFPLFDSNLKLLSLLNDILQYLNPAAAGFQLKELDLTDETPGGDYRPIDNYQAYAETVSRRYAIQDQLMEAVAAGNTTEALTHSARFDTMLPEQRLDDLLSDRKSLLFAANTTLRIAAARSEIHPVFLHEISVKYAKAIENCTTVRQVEKLREKMVREYCFLVKSKSRLHNTPLIRDVLNYIELNLNQPLSLSDLAKQFGVTGPYLSKLFKQEVKENLTDYVVAQKLHVALRLLTTTTMQIQEIAAYIGIYDCNYFSKIFRTRIGSTPSEYRKRFSIR